MKSVSFSLPPKNLSYSDILVNFELLYRIIDNLKIFFGDNLDKTKDLALKPLCKYNVYIPHHLSNDEFEVLKNLSTN